MDKKEDTLCIGFWGYIAVRNIEYGYKHFRLLLMYMCIWVYLRHFVVNFLGTFSRRQGQIYMDLQFSNRAMQAMGDFAVQFNKNR